MNSAAEEYRQSAAPERSVSRPESTPQSGSLATPQRLQVAAVLLVALLLRMRAAWDWNARHPNGVERLRYGDEPAYDAVARGLLEGAGFPFPDRLPLYPSWVAFWHWVSGFNYDLLIYAQSLMGVLAVLLTYLLARRLAGHWAGILASSVTAVSAVLITHTVHVMPEFMFTVAVLAVALALLRAWRSPAVAPFAAAGALVGVANLIRPTLLFLPLFVCVALLIWSRGRRPAWKQAAAYVAAAYLVTAPWTLHNYLRHGVFLPLSTSNATLWLGSPEYHHLIHDQGYSYFRVWDEIIYPDDDPSVPYPTTIEGERYWSERALRAIQREPLLYGRLVVERLGTYWVGDPVVDWGRTHPFNYRYVRQGRSAAGAIRVLIERAIPIFALVAIVGLRRRWRELLPILVILLYTTLLHAATVARIRMSEPFYPLLLVLIGMAVVQLFTTVRASGASPAPAAARTR